MRNALLAIYLSAPIWISLLVSTIFTFKLIDTIALAVVSEAVVIFSLFLSYRLPFELFRKIIHVSGIVIILYAVYLDTDRLILLSIISMIFLLSVPLYLFPNRFPNLLRNLALKSVRYQENSIRCITHFLFAVLLMLLLMPYNFIILGLIISVFGDPVAFIVGRHHGKRKIIRDKTLEGSIAFFAVVYVALLLLTQSMYISIIGALSGAVVEHISGRYIDDNASVPFVTGALLMFI